MSLLRNYFLILQIAALTLAISACGGGEDDPKGAVAAPRYLYVSSGACYSGNGLTTFTNATSSNMVYRLNTGGGPKEAIADYYASPANVGDTPVSIVSETPTSLLVLVENTTTVGLRRIERVTKAINGSRQTYSGNITALSAQLRAMTMLTDGYLLVSKSTAVEKMKDGSNRLLAGVNPWLSLSAPVSSCTTSATLISSITKLNNGSIVFAHAAAGAARVGVVAPLGYNVAGDCKSATSAPNAAAFPTAMVYDGTNNILLVAYGGATASTDLNSIYAYSVNESTGVLSNPQKVYDASLFGSTYNYLLFGISAMAYDATSGDIFVSTSVSTGATVSNYRIERLHYDPTQLGTANASVLVKRSTFYDFGNDTKCISSMILAE